MPVLGPCFRYRDAAAPRPVAALLLLHALLCNVVASSASIGSDAEVKCPDDCEGECISGRCVLPTAYLKASPDLLPASVRRTWSTHLEQTDQLVSPGRPPARRPVSASDDVVSDTSAADAEDNAEPETPSIADLPVSTGSSRAAQSFVEFRGGDGSHDLRQEEDSEEDEEEQVRNRLKSARRVEADLSAENDELRKELMQWRAAGEQVAEREARVVKLLQDRMPPSAHQRYADALEAADTSQPSSLMAMSNSLHSYVFTKGTSEDGTEQLNGLNLVLMFVSINAVGFLIWQCGAYVTGKTLSGQEVESASRTKRWNRESLWKARDYMTPVLQRVGFGHHVLEISEIQVGNWHGCPDIVMVLQTGSKELRAWPLGPPDEGLLRFQGAFAVKVRKQELEGKCTFWLADKDTASDERHARVDVRGQDLLSVARDPHREYFSFDLSILAEVRPAWPQMDGRSAATSFRPGTRPYVAMRIRDITGTKAAQQEMDHSGPP